VDNVCHTLMGAAFGEAGLKQRTRYGNATLMIASNLPDLDVLVFLTDTSSLPFRRGWTHGVVAQVLLPIALTASVWLAAWTAVRIGTRIPFPLRPPHSGPRRADARQKYTGKPAKRLRGISRAEPLGWFDRRGGAARSAVPLRLGWVWALSCVGVYTHVFLDFLNNYGIRLLAPFDWRWFYGDAVFIVDPWLWLGLGAGVWLARRYRLVAPARASLLFAAGYVTAMLVSSQAARTVVADVWRETRGTEPRALMVGPLPLTPFTRAVIVDAGDRYEAGTFRWWPTGILFESEAVPKNDGDPAVAAARAQARTIREFLVWSRFPFWTTEAVDGGTRVTVRDMRFFSAGRQFSASTTVPARPIGSD
jgi:inner membrane protein